MKLIAKNDEITNNLESSGIEEQVFTDIGIVESRFGANGNDKSISDITNPSKDVFSHLGNYISHLVIIGFANEVGKETIVREIEA